VIRRRVCGSGHCISAGASGLSREALSNFLTHPFVVALAVPIATVVLSWIVNRITFERQRRFKLWERRLGRHDELVDLAMEALVQAGALSIENLFSDDVQRKWSHIDRRISRLEHLKVILDGRARELWDQEPFFEARWEDPVYGKLSENMELLDFWRAMKQRKQEQDEQRPHLRSELQLTLERLSRTARVTLYNDVEGLAKTHELNVALRACLDAHPLDDDSHSAFSKSLDGFMAYVASRRDALPELGR